MVSADTPPPAIMLVAAEDGAWLLRGEEHLDAMLKGGGDYPLPVAVIQFADMRALRDELGRDVPLTSLWAIHPKIMERLKTDGHLLEIAAEPS